MLYRCHYLWLCILQNNRDLLELERYRQHLFQHITPLYFLHRNIRVLEIISKNLSRSSLHWNNLNTCTKTANYIYLSLCNETYSILSFLLCLCSPTCLTVSSNSFNSRNIVFAFFTLSSLDISAKCSLLEIIPLHSARMENKYLEKKIDNIVIWIIIESNSFV